MTFRSSQLLMYKTVNFTANGDFPKLKSRLAKL